MYDCVLPLRLRSTPAIFSSGADAVEWILKHKFSSETLLDHSLQVENGKLLVYESVRAHLLISFIWRLLDDHVLPFKLLSSPVTFNSMAYAVELILKHN